MPHHLPTSSKDAFLLSREARRIGVEMRGQCPRPCDIGLNLKGLKRVRHIESEIIVSWDEVSNSILKSNMRP
jgi:hypothetical protein